MIAWLAGIAWGGVLVDRIAAVVDDDVVLLSEVYELGGSFVAESCPTAEPACVRRRELEILDALVRRSLVKAELRRLDLTVTGADVDQAIDTVIQDNGFADRAALRAAVEAQDMRWDAYREQLTEQLGAQRFQGRVLAPRVAVTEDEVRDQYQRAVGMTEAIEVEVLALGIPVPPTAPPETAEAMRAQAARLVEELNTDALAWEQAIADFDGAHLATVFGGRRWRQGQLVAALDERAFQVPVGQAQGPLVLNGLLVIFEVAKREAGRGAPADAPPYEELAPKIREKLFSQKLELAEEEWYQITRRQASVQILLENP